jgi:DNA-binding NarL/FixJ family response regulator
MPPIRVLIADDHPVVQQGLVFMLSAQPDMTVVAVAADGVEAISLALEHRPDVAVLDLVMPRSDGVEAAAVLTQRLPALKILVLTSYAEDDRVFAAIKAGVQGLLLKHAATDELITAIRAVHKGQTVLDPVIVQKLLAVVRAKLADEAPIGSLTPREREVLGLLAQGSSNHQIAVALRIGERTVAVHVRSILDKLQLANRTQAALFAREHRLG